MKYLLGLLIVAFSIVPVSSLFGATYYVDMDGSDHSGNGSHAEPWGSASHALSKSRNGDTVSINDGTYSENQLIVPPGVSVTSTSKDYTKVHLQPASALGLNKPFIQISSAAPGSQGDQTISHLEIDGVNGAATARVGILVNNRNDVRVHHCYIHDFKAGNGSHGVKVKSSEIDATNKWWNFFPGDVQEPGNDHNLHELWPENPVENFELDHNIITDCGYRESLGGGALYGSVYPYNLKNSSIHDNTINAVGSRAECILATSAFLWNVDIYNNELTIFSIIPSMAEDLLPVMV